MQALLGTNFGFGEFFYNISNGNELIIVATYYIIAVGKYHKAYVLTMYISAFQYIISVLQLIYLDPKPFCINLASDITGQNIDPEDDKINIKLMFNAKGFGNPGREAVAATMFAFYIIQ